MRLLVVEDAPKLLGILVRDLGAQGYAVDGVGSGNEALERAIECPYAAIVLDLRLPDIDGVEVCRRLRAASVWTPVMMLTSRDAVEDRVGGLDSGADDYLSKPFAFPELFARVRALVRRGAVERPTRLVVGDLEVDPAARAAARGGAPIDLTAREYALLEYLMRHPSTVLRRRHIIEHVWDYAYQGDSNIVDVYVRALREKIDRPFGCASLQTVRGVGYRIVPDAVPADLA